MGTTTNSINRLRAASGLVPLIEDGLNTSQLSAEKATAMAAFCQWAVQDAEGSTAEALKLIDSIQQGLTRIQKQLSTAEVELID
jgi:hypothetical protein